MPMKLSDATDIAKTMLHTLRMKWKWAFRLASERSEFACERSHCEFDLFTSFDFYTNVRMRLKVTDQAKFTLKVSFPD